MTFDFLCSVVNVWTVVNHGDKTLFTDIFKIKQ